MNSYPERLGEYELLERLGGGAMGVVYLARQASLDRRVALKLIHPEHLYFPGMRERFLREVEATARLQHPGIVTIHAFGEEQGLPYFAMDRIEGCTLAEALHALPAERSAQDLTGEDLLRAVTRCTPGSRREAPLAQVPLYGGSLVEVALRIVASVAGALAHAHERGVLHRDVKPSNVMLTPQGRVLLLDFGVAAIQGQVSRLTRTGAVVGSLPYLAPEHFRGDAPASERSDLYALGVTLYELLALRLPFEGGTFDSLRAEKLGGAPLSLRLVNPAIAWDVETVCMTAMESDPARRYATAQGFAADLDNLLHLRPIAARRPGLTLQAQRWMQRHPALAVAAGLVALAAVVVPAAAFRIQQSHLKRLTTEQDRTAAQRTRALANFRGVLDVVQRGIERVQTAAFDDLPGIESLRRSTFEDALAVYVKFRSEAAEFPELRRDFGRSKVLLAELLQELGRRDESEPAWQEALATLEPVARANPTDAALAYDVARCHEALAQLALERGDPPQALEHAATAIDAFEALHAAAPEDAGPLRHVVRSRLARCAALLRAGRIEESNAAGGELVELIREEVVPRAHEDENRLDAGYALQQVSAVLVQTGSTDGLESLVACADELLSQPFSQPYRRPAAHMATALWVLRAELARLNGDVEGETEAKLQAVAGFRELVGKWPSIPLYEEELASALTNLGILQHRSGEFAQALETTRESCELLSSWTAREPELIEPRARLAGTLLNLAVIELDSGRLDDALAHLEASQAEVDQLAARNPDDPRLPPLRMADASYLSEVQLARGDCEAATTAARAMIALDPDDPENVRRANIVLDACGTRQPGQ
jgi:tetratricopeptide (TPR) repeat protein